MQDSPKVKVYFTREAGEEVNDEADTGYALSVRDDQTYTNGLSQADAQNYVINAEGFNAEFVILKMTHQSFKLALTTVFTTFTMEKKLQALKWFIKIHNSFCRL